MSNDSTGRTDQAEIKIAAAGWQAGQVDVAPNRPRAGDVIPIVHRHAIAGGADDIIVIRWHAEKERPARILKEPRIRSTAGIGEEQRAAVGASAIRDIDRSDAGVQSATGATALDRHAFADANYLARTKLKLILID